MKNSLIKLSALIAIALVAFGVNVAVQNHIASKQFVRNYVDSALREQAIDFTKKLTNEERVGAAPDYFAGLTFTLAGSGVSSSATSITLTSFTIAQTGQLIRTSDLIAGVGNKFYITIEPGSRTRQEVVSCTAVTQNANGTATLTGCSRGLAPITPYTASTTLAFVHAGGSQVILSNPPQLYRDIIAYIDAATVAGAVDSSLTAKGIVEKATAAEAASNAAVGSGNTSAALALTTDLASSTRVAGSPVVVVSSSTDGYIDNSFISTSTLYTNFTHLNSTTTFSGNVVGATKFGGNGSDGALSITSGTTNIDLGGAAVVVKNYSSISITGTGALTFSNPNANGTTIVLKSQGDITVTSSANPAIDARSMGGAGGSGGGTTGGNVVGDGAGGGASILTSGSAGTAGTAGSAGSDGSAGIGTYKNNAGAGGSGSGGAAGTSYASNSGYTPSIGFALDFPVFIPGSGGGGGGGGTDSAGGAGGRGGGALYLEARGSYNVTGVINASGANGSAATGSFSGGGGGGGGGGMIVAIFNALTANTGTYTVSGGSGGASSGGGTGAAGGVGYSFTGFNTRH